MDLVRRDRDAGFAHYIWGLEPLDTLPIASSIMGRKKRGAMMDYAEIETAARAVLVNIYRNEGKVRPGFLAPMQMIEPDVVATHLGYRLAELPSLGSWGSGPTRFETAGVVDKQRKLITLSQRFRLEVRRFTAAHEIGHVVLNHPGTVIHRDRPVFEIETALRTRIEREADYFAACLLVPRRLLEIEFEKRFCIGPPLPLTDDVAFNLCASSAHALMRAGPGSYEFAATVASAKAFNGHHFRSLADAFNVSVSAMAIRLRELQLIQD